MFLLGLVPGLVAFVVRRNVTEPAIFLERAKARNPKMPLGLLVKDGPTMRISLGMLILCSVQNFGYYALMIWLPSYLSAHFGYTLTQSALWTGVRHFGVRTLRGPGWAPPCFIHLSGGRLHYGLALFAAD
jgi:hypothetical protein